MFLAGFRCYLLLVITTIIIAERIINTLFGKYVSNHLLTYFKTL
jgi:hypothetical protein